MDKPSYRAKKLMLMLLGESRCINKIRSTDAWQESKDPEVEQYLYRYAKEMEAVLYRTENDLYFLPQKNICVYGKKNLDIIKDLKNVSLNEAYLADFITRRLVTIMFKEEIADDQRRVIQYRPYVTVSELCDDCQRIFEKIVNSNSEQIEAEPSDEFRLASLWMEKSAQKSGIENAAMDFVRNNLVSYWTANRMFHLTGGKIYPTKITRDIMDCIFTINDHADYVFSWFERRE